jgi:hypothetical protein
MPSPVAVGGRMMLRGAFTRLHAWTSRHEIVPGFLVTMAGVYAAFWLTGLGEHRALDNATRQRLHLVVLESQYNGTTAKQIVDAYADSAAMSVSVDRPNAAVAAAALGDANILGFLPLHKVSTLQSYAAAVATLNQALQVHQRVLESAGYRPTPAEVSIRENVRSNAASVLAMAIVLREQLGPYFDETAYDHEAMRRIEDRVRYIKAKALAGEVHLSKEE